MIFFLQIPIHVEKLFNHQLKRTEVLIHSYSPATIFNPFRRTTHILKFKQSSAQFKYVFNSKSDRMNIVNNLTAKTQKKIISTKK